MDLKLFESHLRTLITLEENADPVVSYSLDLHAAGGREYLRQRTKTARKALPVGERRSFDEAIGRVERFMKDEISSDARSVALFARGGKDPFFLPLEFEVGLPSRLFVESTPVIFHLVELKDSFDRYVVLIATEDDARILEVSLGSITRDLWTRRPELRKRVGREWTKRHYHNHRRDRAQRFIKEKIAILEQIVRSRGHSQLVLAGSPKMVARVRASLPKALSDIVIDIVPAATRDRSEDIVAATLASFVEQERRESLAVVDLLRQELRRGGLAVAGYEMSRDALEVGQANILVLSAEYTPEDVPIREELIRLAEDSGVQIEIVRENDFLLDLGGAGCLLRYPAFGFFVSRPEPATTEA